MEKELTQKQVKLFLKYNSRTGVFVWKERARKHFPCIWSYKVWNGRYSGKEAGAMTSDGYRRISINDVRYKAHRLAFLYARGYMPDNVLHEDQNKLNNRIRNLRDDTHKENCRNQVIRKNNTSGATGVYWRKDIEKWASQIMVDGRCIPLGTYKIKADAVKSRREADKKYGFHKNHGTKAA